MLKNIFNKIRIISICILILSFLNMGHAGPIDPNKYFSKDNFKNLIIGKWIQKSKFLPSVIEFKKKGKAVESFYMESISPRNKTNEIKYIYNIKPGFKGKIFSKTKTKPDLIINAGKIVKRKTSTVYDARTNKVLRKGPIKI